MNPTFLDSFCRHFGVPADQFGKEVLRRTLYPHARLVQGLCAHELFGADRDFISSVALLTRRKGLASEVHEFQQDPRSRGFWRHTMRLRVSVGRMQALFDAVWGRG